MVAHAVASGAMLGMYSYVQPQLCSLINVSSQEVYLAATDSRVLKLLSARAFFSSLERTPWKSRW
jgi:hypothetical protein